MSVGNDVFWGVGWEKEPTTSKISEVMLQRDNLSFHFLSPFLLQLNHPASIVQVMGWEKHVLSFSHQYCTCLWPCFWKSFRVQASILSCVSVMLLFYRVPLNCWRSHALPQKQENLMSRLSGQEHKYPHRTADQKGPAGWILLNLPRFFILH